MTKKFIRSVYIGLIAILAVQMVSAQDDREAAAAAAGDKYVISAKAGGVNYVEGAVSVVRKDGRSGYLTKRDEIAVGDVVATGADSRAEILLNPGSFLRIGADSSFEFKTTSLDDLRIKVISGSAIFEVFASREFKVRVTTPNAKLLLIKSGVFRVDALTDGSANIEVWEGESLLGDRESTLLKSGRAATLKDGVATFRKLERSDKDEFVAWSKTRGKELAKQSAKLRKQSLGNSLMSSFNQGRWGMYNSFGLWVYNAMYGGYCFLPFGNGWYSPYGFGYGSCICHYNLPTIIYLPPIGGGGGGGNGLTPIMTSGDRSLTPPFVRMGGNGGVRGIPDSGYNSDRPGRSGGFGNSGNSDTGSRPVYSPPPSDRQVSAPPPSSTGSKPPRP